MIQKNHSFFTKFLITLFSVSFAFYAVFAPKIFAQSRNATRQKNVQIQNYVDTFGSIFNFVANNYVDEVDLEKLYAGALNGMMESLDDPYSVYLDTTSMRSLNDTTIGNFGGVGLTISKPIASTPEKPAYVEISTPIEGGPGYKAGIHAGDLIISIEGKPTPEMTMEEVLSMLRGEVGGKVNIVVRRGKTMELPFTLVREIIEVPTVKFDTINQNNKKIGYIKIIEFTPMTAEKVQQALDSFAQGSKVDGIIIDLRNNPGGLITSVSQVADKFIDEGLIVCTKNRYGNVSSAYEAHPNKTTAPKVPLVVLINKGSASASEILSGSLKDHKMAYLVGERSYGKGSVQQVIPLYNEDGVKLTMARYYTASGVSIDKIGIPPDREVKLGELTEEQEQIYVDLANADVIATYVDEHPDMSENDISAFAAQLSQNYALDQKLLRRLIRVQVERKMDNPPLIDLDYDDQLSCALDIIENEDFSKLLSETKTLKELQDAQLLEEKKE